MTKSSKLTFIGGGNMAEAILRGLLQAELIPAQDIFVCDINEVRCAQMTEKYGIRTGQDPAEAAAAGEMVLLAVKPNVCASVLPQIKSGLQDKALITIAAGWQTEQIRALVHNTTRVLRIMPNTPALVGAGMSVLCAEHNLTADEYALVETIFNALGRTLTLPEKYFDAVTAVSGSGPAYVFMFIEAMADGGVHQGLPRPVALELAAQTVLGSARMLLETGTHPGALKDTVCSPGGTTIEAVFALEQGGMRAAVMDAVIRCGKKSAALRD